MLVANLIRMKEEGFEPDRDLIVMLTAEKVYVDFRLEAADPGGHSSIPRADNAISCMSRTLAALGEHHPATSDCTSELPRSAAIHLRVR